MGDCDELLERAQRNPAGLKFRELCSLAECFGFEFVRTRGGHHIYKRPGYRRLLNLQSMGAGAKAYQVRQLLTALEELGVSDRGQP